MNEVSNNNWIRIFLYTVLLFIFSGIGFTISKSIPTEILTNNISYTYNPFFEILGLIIIVIFKVKFDKEFLKIKNSLQRK